MAVYVVGRVVIRDPSFVADYIPKVQAIVEEHGGRYLVRSTDLEVVEANGDPPTVVVVIEFPSKEAAKAFYTSDAYRPYLAVRRANSDAELILVDGL